MILVPLLGMGVAVSSYSIGLASHASQLEAPMKAMTQASSQNQTSGTSAAVLWYGFPYTSPSLPYLPSYLPYYYGYYSPSYSFYGY
jgi:hypothetical protein